MQPYHKICIADTADDWVAHISPEQVDRLMLFAAVEDGDGNLCLVPYVRSLAEAKRHLVVWMDLFLAVDGIEGWHQNNSFPTKVAVDLSRRHGGGLDA
jgi:hypothetical protein